MKIAEKKYRILLLAPQGVAGGIATWTQYLLKYTDQQLIEYHLINTAKLYDILGKKLSLAGSIWGMRDSIIRFFSMMTHLCKVRPHAVYFTCAPSIGFLVRDVFYMILLRLLRKRYIVHFRGGKLDYFFGRNAIERFFIKRALSGALVLIAITRPVEKQAKKVFGDALVRYLPNMIDDALVEGQPVKQIRPVNDGQPMRLLHVAFMAPEKGVLELLDALGKVKSSFVCKLVGDVAEENRRLIEERIITNRLQGSVSLTGRKSGAELREYFQKADLFVFPSHSEGFPNVILEAMAGGVPILSTDVGNIREMTDARGNTKAAILLNKVNPIDVNELAEKIDTLLKNHKMRMLLSQNGQQRVRQYYTASMVVPQLEQMIVGLLEAKLVK